MYILSSYYSQARNIYIHINILNRAFKCKKIFPTKKYSEITSVFIHIKSYIFFK